MTITRRLVAGGAFLGVCALTQVALATEEASNAAPTAPSFAMAYQEDYTADTSTEMTTTSMESEETAALPLSFSITYYLYSDYIFRGVNFSDFPGEGVERLNHQVTTDLEVDIAALFGEAPGTWGNFYFGTFFEFFSAQKQLDPDKGGQSLQEVDYILAYNYEIEPIATSAEVGFVFYVFPSNTAANTDEWYLNLEHNDAWMWKWLFPDNEDGILNPYFLYAHDVGIGAGGAWMEFGFSHPFALADFGDMGAFDYLTLTPGVTFAFERKYWGRLLEDPTLEKTGFAYVQYGLNADYDLSGALQIPERFGSLTLSGFLYYNHVGRTYDIDTQPMKDELFGGMSVGWGF